MNNDDLTYEYCPLCDANLTFQKGYRNDLPYWVCRGCGEMLINPELETDTDIIWRCDGCGALLNVQSGFNECGDEWICTECGYKNGLSESDVFISDEEHEADQKNPYKGLTDEEVLRLSAYTDEKRLGGKNNVILVSDRDTGKLFVKKLLTVYDKSIYEFLKDNPIAHMPRIIDIYEGSNCLIVIEEYIEGDIVEDMLGKGPLPEEEAVRITKNLCAILNDLHSLPTPIVHRDIKPSNIIITPDKEVYLLDMNVAKWYDPDKTDDTRYLGTQYYAAPEQAGYGLSASSSKADIYATGMLFNKMLTNYFPKEKHPSGHIWEIIKHCISMEAGERYNALDLTAELEKLRDD